MLKRIDQICVDRKVTKNCIFSQNLLNTICACLISTDAREKTYKTQFCLTPEQREEKRKIDIRRRTLEKLD